MVKGRGALVVRFPEPPRYLAAAGGALGGGAANEGPFGCILSARARAKSAIARTHPAGVRRLTSATAGPSRVHRRVCGRMLRSEKRRGEETCGLFLDGEL